MLLALAGMLLLALAVWWRFGRAVIVDTVRLVQADVPVQVTGPGTVQARVSVNLAARVTAAVATMHADVGDAVQAGQLLATLDDRDLLARRAAVAGQRETLNRTVEAAQAALSKARTDTELARSRHQRDTELRAQGFLSAAGMDSARAALQAAEAAEHSAAATLAARRADRSTLEHEFRVADVASSHARLLSPINGLVVQRLVEPGSTVMPGSTLFRLVDPASLWVAMRVDEAMLDRVQKGQPARIVLRTGEQLNGRVARIARQSDAATREVDVHVAFDAPPSRFVIDQEAEVQVDTGRFQGLRLPVTALLRDPQGRQGVLVVDDGRAAFVPVRAGQSDGRHLIVQGALSAGAEIVAPALGVRDGMRVQPRPAN